MTWHKRLVSDCQPDKISMTCDEMQSIPRGCTSAADGAGVVISCLQTAMQWPAAVALLELQFTWP